MGLFDDLIPKAPAANRFADLIPKTAAPPMARPDMSEPAPMTAPPGLAEMLRPAAPGPAPLQPSSLADMLAPPEPLDNSSLGGDLEAAWLQAQQIIPALKAGVALNDIRQAGMERPEPLPGPATEMEAANQRVREAWAGQAPATLADVLPQIIGKSQEIAQIPMNPAAAAVGGADTFGEGLSAAADDPLGVLRTYGVRSLGTSVPSMLAAIAGSAVGGPGGAAAAAGAVGAGTEAAMSVADGLQTELLAAGVDVSSPDALAAYIDGNPEAFDGVLTRALTRAGVIGAVDAVTGGVTGGLARAAARAGRPGTIAGHVAAGGLVEPLGEGAGEGLAQLATDGKINPGEVLAEIAGGAGMGVPTTAGQVAVEALGSPKAAEAVPEPSPIEQEFQAYLRSRAAEQVAPPPVAPDPAPPVPPPVAGDPAVEEDVAVTQPVAVIPPEQDRPPPEPKQAQRKPLTNLVRRAGIQIDPDGPAGKELRANGLTSRTHPGLFKRGGYANVDNIPITEHPDLHLLLGDDGSGNYLPPDGLLSAIIQEAHGQPVQNAAERETAAIRAEWERMQTEVGRAYVDAQHEWDQTFPAPANDPGAMDDPDYGPAQRTERAAAMVDGAIDRLELRGVVTEAEREAIVARIDREGGSIEGAIHSQIVRTVLDAEAGYPVDTSTSEIPFDAEAPGDAGGTSAEGASGARPTGRDPFSDEGGDPGAADAGRAGPGPDAPFLTEQTPEGEQYLVPGAERRQTGDAQRQKAEIAARLQQSKMRRGDQARVEDDESGLFGETPSDLFGPDVDSAGPVGSNGAGPSWSSLSSPPDDTPPSSSGGVFSSDEGKAEDRAAARRSPPGRLSPRFLDFSFTNRASVYGAAFRAAGLDPDEARFMPIEKQIAAVRRVLEERFGVKVEMPTVKVQKRNLVGRKVTVEKQSITTRESLDQMLDAFRNMQMLASVLGVPEKALALEIDGKPLTISLVSVGRLRGALGMFSWGAAGRKITMPGRSNSFAHEWGHALDHYLAANSGKDGLKGMLSRAMDSQGVQRPLSPRGALTDAFAGIMRALYGDSAQMSALVLRLQVESAQIGPDGKPTAAAVKARRIMTGIREGRRPPAEYLGAYFASSAEYDRTSNAGGYFTDPAEMFARAFEAWVGRTVAQVSDLPQGFMSKGDWAYDTNTDERLALTFPKEGDALAFSTAMLDMQHAMSRISLFGHDAPAVAPEDVDINSPNDLLKRMPSTGVMAREKVAMREMLATWKRVFGKPRSGLAAAGRLADGIWHDYITSLTSTVHAMAARQTGADAKKALIRIADMIGKDPGAGRLIKQTWQEAVEVNTNRNLRRLDGALAKAFRNKRLTEFQSQKLRALLTGQKTDADPAIKQLAADIRTILNDVWYDMKGAGIEVGFAAGYLPRITNLAEVDTAPAEFTRDAAKVYALMFEREVMENEDAETQAADINTVIRRLREARLPTWEGETEAASRLSEADEELVETWRVAMKALKAAEGNATSTKAGDRVVAAQAAQEALLEMLQARFAAYSAENWRGRLRVGNANDFDTMGPTSSFLKGRTLPPETDQMMERWLENDPLELVSGYVHSAARRAEYAKRFGASGEKLENMLAAAEKDGATSEQVHLVRRAVNSATGRFRHPSKAGEQATTAVFFLGTISLLGRATFASIAEPITAGLRSGEVRDSARALVSNLRLLTSKSRREDVFELARTIGLVTSSMREGVMANRMGADSAALTKGASRALAEFFHRSLLSPLTNFQHVANLPVAHAIIMRHLKRTTGRMASFADRELNELGIAREDRADLLQWLEGLDGMPTPEDLLGPDGSYYNTAAGIWASAVTRITGETIQSPKKSDRPIMANDPTAAALYGIMSFSMAFHRNIIVRTLRRGLSDKPGIKGAMGRGARMTMNAAAAMPAVGALFAGQFLATVIRELLFNAEVWQEKDDDDELLDWLLERAFYRTGLTGMFDPLIQLAVGVKYDRDLTAITAGPHLGFMLQNVMKIMQTTGRNSANTNTSEHNAARAFYQLTLQPALMLSANMLPGGPLTGLPSTALIWWGSAPSASDAFANGLVGEKGRSYKKEGIDPPWWEMGKKADEEE